MAKIIDMYAEMLTKKSPFSVKVIEKYVERLMLEDIHPAHFRIGILKVILDNLQLFLL